MSITEKIKTIDNKIKVVFFIFQLRVSNSKVEK